MADSRYTIEELTLVNQGLTERTVLDSSKAGYIIRCRTLANLMDRKLPLVERREAFEFAEGVDGGDPNVAPLCHIGKARGLFKFKLPMTVRHASCLFGMISIDDTLPRKRKADQLNENNVEGRDDNTIVGDGDRLEDLENPIEDDAVYDVDNDADVVVDLTNPAKNKRTIPTQSYQNFKSSLKWWHEHNNLSMDKVGHRFPPEVDAAIDEKIKSYKKDVGFKKRAGVMKAKEGKKG